MRCGAIMASHGTSQGRDKALNVESGNAAPMRNPKVARLVFVCGFCQLKTIVW